MSLHPDALNALAYADHGSPRDILGVHRLGSRHVIRTLRPDASTVDLMVEGAEPQPMRRIHDGGIFELELPSDPPPAYYFLVTNHYGHTFRHHDAYSVPSVFGEMDLFLFGEGRHRQIYNLMGAHPRVVNGIAGVNFAVWAPNARRVSVVGNFNYWDARYHPMQPVRNGVWELFVPGIGPGEAYKFAIRSHHRGYEAEKSDPYAFFAERRPQTASVVADLSTYMWGDDAWMQARAQHNILTSPLSIYELHLGSWRRGWSNEWLTYRQLAAELVPYIREMGYTHIEVMPVAEHPFDASWGYQITGYYAPTSRYGTPQDFMHFVDQCHQAGIGVILDWVPAHFPKDGHSLSYFDGTHLYSHEDPRLGEQNDWGTYIFNYGRGEVRNFLLANALFWLKQYHIDGLRVDAVTSMVYLDFSRKPNQWLPNKYGGRENLDAVDFLREANTIIHEECPGAFTVAEESTSWAGVSRPVYIGGLGFTLKWNMGWMHDTLNYVKLDPLYRKFHHNQLTFMMMYAYTENFVLALSHDEVVHGKGSLINKTPGDWWQKFATLRLVLGYQYTIVGKKLNFMGHEIAQWREWSEDRALDWDLLALPTHQGVQTWMRDLNHLYRSSPALYELDFDPRGCYFIDADDHDRSIYTYARFGSAHDDVMVIVLNFTPVVYEDYRMGVPRVGAFVEILNSDAARYGGSDVVNTLPRQTEPIPMNKHDQSIALRVPPLGIAILRYAPPAAPAPTSVEHPPGTHATPDRPDA